MKIADIITEAAVQPYTKDELARDKALSILEECDFYKNNKTNPLWRGSKSTTEEFVFIDPASGVRKSQNTANYYTILMDNSPYYEGWPKRSQSLVCSLSYQKADNYARQHIPYAVIPLNGSKIGVCPRSDIWDTFVDLLDSIHFPYFSEITSLMTYLDFPESYQSMRILSSQEGFNKKIRQKFPGSDLGDENFIDYMHRKMSPEKTGMRLENSSTMDTNEYGGNECWTDGKCLLIRADIYNDIIGLRAR
jgi:hypothetical protein